MRDKNSPLRRLGMALLPAVLALSGAALRAQHAHSNPAVAGYTTLDFGVVSIPAAGTSTILLPSAAGAWPTVTSGTATIINPLLSHPYAFQIHLDTNPSLYPWRCYLSGAALGADGVTTYTLAPNVTCRLKAPVPNNGTYPQPPPTGYLTSPIYIGGTLTVTSAATPGVYTLTPTWTQYNAAASPYFTEDNYGGGSAYVPGAGQGNGVGGYDVCGTLTIRVDLRVPPAPLQVTPTANLHFGTVLATPTAAGTIVVPATGAARTVTGTLTDTATLLPQASRAVFTVDGAQNAYVQFLLPTTATLTGPGGNLTASSFTWAVTNAASSGNTGGGTGNFRFQNVASGRTVTFGLGATLTVNTALLGPVYDGTYSGTYPITFAYR